MWTFKCCQVCVEYVACWQWVAVQEKEAGEAESHQPGIHLFFPLWQCVEGATVEKQSLSCPFRTESSSVISRVVLHLLPWKIKTLLSALTYQKWLFKRKKVSINLCSAALSCEVWTDLVSINITELFQTGDNMQRSLSIIYSLLVIIHWSCPSALLQAVDAYSHMDILSILC